MRERGIDVRILIGGYRPYEIGIFKSDQQEVTVLKAFIRNKLLEYIDEGAEWFIIQGYTGIELYAAEEIIRLKEAHYDIRLGVLMPFHQFDDRYNEMDQALLQKVLAECDFKDYIYKQPYSNPGMFKHINRFLISNTDGALIFFDEEADAKVRFLYNAILEFSGENPYNIERIQFDEINSFIDSGFDN